MSKRRNALLLALVPGLGHLYLGWHWRGLFVFSLFALAVNGMYLAETRGLAGMSDRVFILCRTAGLAALCYSVLHVAYLSKRFQAKPVAERKDYHFKRGLTRYLAGAFDEARAEFQTVLKLDPLEIDARFHLGMTYLALGDRRRAGRTLRRCRADDLESKWSWEIETQLKDLRAIR